MKTSTNTSPPPLPPYNSVTIENPSSSKFHHYSNLSLLQARSGYSPGSSKPFLSESCGRETIESTVALQASIELHTQSTEILDRIPSAIIAVAGICLYLRENTFSGRCEKTAQPCTEIYNHTEQLLHILSLTIEATAPCMDYQIPPKNHCSLPEDSHFDIYTQPKPTLKKSQNTILARTYCKKGQCYFNPITH